MTSYLSLKRKAVANKVEFYDASAEQRYREYYVECVKNHDLAKDIIENIQANIDADVLMDKYSVY